ncbi:hypothetical protein HGRIS_012331 [Hohenbuehelia grisea]|uniref:Uncharacterized protein n=1 Tax=Hohenbuehelia grisea TaxID=104357 RepID=A0ABR3IS10_9AGAR
MDRACYCSCADPSPPTASHHLRYGPRTRDPSRSRVQPFLRRPTPTQHLACTAPRRKGSTIATDRASYSCCCARQPAPPHCTCDPSPSLVQRVLRRPTTTHHHRYGAGMRDPSRLRVQQHLHQPATLQHPRTWHTQSTAIARGTAPAPTHRLPTPPLHPARRRDARPQPIASPSLLLRPPTRPTSLHA